MQTRDKPGQIKSCHTFIHSISENQAAGETEEDGEGRGGSDVGPLTKAPRSLSLAAAGEVSVRRSPARTQWPPGFQSLDPAHIMKEWQMTSLNVVIFVEIGSNRIVSVRNIYIYIKVALWWWKQVLPPPPLLGC